MAHAHEGRLTEPARHHVLALLVARLMRNTVKRIYERMLELGRTTI
jgi:hypothetical protein